MYLNYIIPFISSFILSLVITPIVGNFTLKKKIATPKIRERDSHQKITPRLGGIAVFLSFYLVIIAILLISPQSLNFVKDKFLGIDKNLFGLLLSGLVWIIVGIIDDVKGLKPFTKFFWQGICGLIIVGFGINIWWLSNPFGGLNIILGPWTYLLVPLWIGLLMNVLNWFDGIDGLTPGISIITLVILFLLSMNPIVNQPATAMLCAILTGSVLGFLPYNWHPSKIFLGDSGSMFLGLMIGVFSIISGAKLATAALVLGVPIIDAVWVIIKRLIQKKSPFYADKSHLHHRFLEAGFNVKQTVIIIYAICAGFGIIALQSDTAGKVRALIWLLISMIVIGIILFVKKHKQNNR